VNAASGKTRSARPVPRTIVGKYPGLDSESTLDEVEAELELRALNAELRALEAELFRQYERGVKDASERLLTK
jgi:hypothetical protein